MLADLSGKTALVTGGASGLGRGICHVLAECGADVAVADMNLEGARKVVGEVSEHGRRARAFQVDVTKEASVRKMVDEVLAAFGKIDILVNSAGVIGASGFEETTTSREEDWDITYQVNVKGTVLALEAVAEHMKARRYGKIVNIASHGGRQGGPGGGAYGASKAAVIHLTQSFAMDLAPYNINVNSICPGAIWTPMFEQIAQRQKRNDPTLKDLTPRQIFERLIEQRCPLKREQTPEDMGKMAAFLASEDATNITGQAINVNGGARMN
ncbi:MAG: SDR family NAD(P)-dependent oxidoreductase [Chloroflexota bacterium]|nr:SDR family NAD(P)-dependent oxidoreductase [Chloroflexota bacterium]